MYVEEKEEKPEEDKEEPIEEGKLEKPVKEEYAEERLVKKKPWWKFW